MLCNTCADHPQREALSAKPPCRACKTEHNSPSCHANIKREVLCAARSRHTAPIGAGVQASKAIHYEVWA